MKKFLSYLAVAMCLLGEPVFSQTEGETPELGLPGDNLDLYAVLDLFQKSKTIEEFEKSLNEQKTGINNMDLDLDKKVDFIKVVTTKKDQSYTFVLQIAVSEKETQDVAVILVDKDTNGKVTMQIVGDKELYGKDYVVEPRTSAAAVTANPAYVGEDPVTKDVPATQTVVVVEQAPIVQYVYSPAYVPYYPPYYYGYYPPYFAAFTVMAVGIYRHNNYHYHGGGYGYHNTTVIHNHNNYNNYNGNRNTSDRVSHNNSSGRYNSGNRNSASTREAGTGSNRGNSASTRPSNSNMSSNRGSLGNSASTRPSNNMSSSNMSSSNRSSGSSAASRSSSSRSSSSMSGGGGRTRSGGGGGFSGGGGGRRR